MLTGTDPELTSPGLILCPQEHLIASLPSFSLPISRLPLNHSSLKICNSLWGSSIIVSPPLTSDDLPKRHLGSRLLPRKHSPSVWIGLPGDIGDVVLVK